MLVCKMGIDNGALLTHRNPYIHGGHATSMWPEKPHKSIDVAAQQSLQKRNSHLGLEKTISEQGARQHPDHASKLGQLAKVCYHVSKTWMRVNISALLTSEIVVKKKHCLQHVHPSTQIIWDAACKLV